MSREPLANLNGEQMPLSEVKVSAQDRGFLFGDSVYEVLRVYGGKPWLLEEHWAGQPARLAAYGLDALLDGEPRRSAGKRRPSDPIVTQPPEASPAGRA